MIARVMPLAVCLLWLGCEVQFSASVAVANIQFSVAEIKDGLDSFLTAKSPRAWKVADNEPGGR